VSFWLGFAVGVAVLAVLALVYVVVTNWLAMGGPEGR
jgi:hypothetical protein